MADREIPWGSGLLNPPSGGQNYGGRLDPTLVDEEEMNPDSYNVMANLNLPTSFSIDQVGVSSGGAGGDWENTQRLAGNALTMEVFVEGLKEGRISEAELEQAIESGAELIRGRPRIVAVAALAKFRRDKARQASLNESRFQGTSQDQNFRTWDEAFQADQDIAKKTFEPPPLMEGSHQAMDEDRFDPPAYLEMYDRAPYGEATPDMLPREGGQPYQTAPGYDTLLEPYPRARGYDLGGLVTPAGPGAFPQTASENMMAMGSSPPPDEFGNRTPVPSSDAQALIQALDAVRRAGTVDQVRGFISSNMANLLTVASQDPDFANRLESIMESMPKGGDILRETGVEYGDPRLSNQDIRGLREVMEQLPRETGRQNLGRIGDPRLSDQDIRGYRELMDQTPSPSLEPYDPLAGSPFVPPEDLPAMMPDWGGNKYAHGGYVHGRGTMPGELRRKGSLPVRVAGGSMGEYRKHREDEDDVRPVRRTLDNALSPTLSRRMFS